MNAFSAVGTKYLKRLNVISGSSLCCLKHKKNGSSEIKTRWKNVHEKRFNNPEDFLASCFGFHKGLLYSLVTSNSDKNKI